VRRNNANQPLLWQPAAAAAEFSANRDQQFSSDGEISRGARQRETLIKKKKLPQMKEGGGKTEGGRFIVLETKPQAAQKSPQKHFFWCSRLIFRGMLCVCLNILLFHHHHHHNQ
jgi:hypothetical protein